MKFNWLFTRKNMFIKVLLDLFLLIIFYIYFYPSKEFLYFPLYTLLTLILILIGYIVGKYHKFQNYDGINIFYYIKTFAIEYLVSSTFIGIIFLILKENINYQLISFLLFFLISSYVVNFIYDVIVDQYTKKENYNWLYIGNKEELNHIKKITSNFKVKNKLHTDQNNPNSKKINFPYKGIVYLDSEEANEYIKKNYPFLSIKKLSLISWCERYTQTIPSGLINKNQNFQAILNHNINNSIEMRIKRILDIFLSISLLLITSPIIFLVSLIIKLEDGGPIFYSQIRTGIYGQTFKIFKLRSMRINSEKEGPQWSSKDDSRVTRVGKFIRKARIDELPQLFSVIHGKMSLIGPRPERPEIEKELIKKIPYYRLRNKFKPGISGWAQVNYPYVASIEDSKIKLGFDLYYIKNYSFLLDVLIFIKTIKVVFLFSKSIPRD